MICNMMLEYRREGKAVCEQILGGGDKLSYLQICEGRMKRAKISRRLQTVVTIDN